MVANKRKSVCVIPTPNKSIYCIGGMNNDTCIVAQTMCGRTCAVNTVTGESPVQMASNVENVSIGWRHHGETYCRPDCVGENTL